MAIPLLEASLTIENAAAAIDCVYMSFDGLMASVATVADTFGHQKSGEIRPVIESVSTPRILRAGDS